MNKLSEITKILNKIEEDPFKIHDFRGFFDSLGKMENFGITWPNPKDYYIHENATPKKDWEALIEKLTAVTIRTLEANKFSDLTKEPFFKKIYTEYPFYVNTVIQKIIKEEYDALLFDDMDREESSALFKNQIKQLIEINPEVLNVMKENEQYNGFRKFLINQEFEYCNVLLELDMAYSVNKKAERKQTLYGPDISDEAFVFLLENTNFDFLTENKYLKAFTIWEGGEVEVIDEPRQWINIVCQSAFEADNQAYLERIDIIKSHPLFENENWRLWDINTLNSSQFQDSIFDIQLNKDPEYLASRISSFEYLRQIREKYHSELDTIKLTHDFKDITLREYILKTENQKIIAEMKIKSEIKPTKTIKPNRF